MPRTSWRPWRPSHAPASWRPSPGVPAAPSAGSTWPSPSWPPVSPGPSSALFAPPNRSSTRTAARSPFSDRRPPLQRRSHDDRRRRLPRRRAAHDQLAPRARGIPTFPRRPERLARPRCAPGTARPGDRRARSGQRPPSTLRPRRDLPGHGASARGPLGRCPRTGGPGGRHRRRWDPLRVGRRYPHLARPRRPRRSRTPCTHPRLRRPTCTPRRPRPPRGHRVGRHRRSCGRAWQPASGRGERPVGLHSPGWAPTHRRAYDEAACGG